MQRSAVRWCAAVALLGIGAGGLAAAQTSGGTTAAPGTNQALPQPDRTLNGPAGSVDSTTTTRAVDRNGVETDTTRSLHKSQIYSSGNGQLHAETRIRTTAPQKTVRPPPQQTTTRLTTTTIIGHPDD